MNGSLTLMLHGLRSTCDALTGAACSWRRFPSLAREISWLRDTAYYTTLFSSWLTLGRQCWDHYWGRQDWRHLPLAMLPCPNCSVLYKAVSGCWSQLDISWPRISQSVSITMSARWYEMICNGTYTKEANKIAPLQVASLWIGVFGPHFLEGSDLFSSDRLGTSSHLEDVVETLDDHTWSYESMKWCARIYII